MQAARASSPWRYVRVTLLEILPRVPCPEAFAVDLGCCWGCCAHLP